MSYFIRFINYKSYPLLFLLCILVVLDLIIFIKLIQFNQKNNQYIAETVLKNDNIRKQILKLVVQGKFIKRTDSNKTIILKGVSSMFFNWDSYDFDDFEKRLEIARGWGINLLGLYLNLNLNPIKLRQLDQVIKWASNNGIYVYLVPWHEEEFDKLKIYENLNKFNKMMQFVANRYKSETNIIYGLWAEPRNLSWIEWVTVAEKIGLSIREINRDSIILMSGIHYGRDLNGMKVRPFKIENVIYDFHDYPFSNANDYRENFNKLSDEMIWDQIKTDYPVLVGEFGGVSSTDFGSEEDLEYISKILQKINEDSLHYTAYTIDPQGELSLIGDDLTLTKKGQMIKNDLINNPPTFFE